MRTFDLSILEPSVPDAGAILITDQDHNDIAEFYHSEHATVGQSYAEALMLARQAIAAAYMLEALKKIAEAGPTWAAAVARDAIAHVHGTDPETMRGTSFPSDGKVFPRFDNQSETQGEQSLASRK